MSDRDAPGPGESGEVSAEGRRSIAAREISGLAITGDDAKVDARRIELHRASTAPDTGKRLHNLPKPATRLFVGRQDELAALEAVMSAGSGVICQAVHGLGGVGKTELALQYAHQRRDRYPMRWWVTADSPASIENGLAALTARMNPELMLTATAAEAARWAVGWLQNQSGWLLVLDNVEQRSDVEPLLAQLDTGHLLITTRRDVNWETLVDGCLRLDMLDRESAVRLLLEPGEQRDVLAAAVLADELGYLPLALQQAAGYLRQTRLPVSAYLDRLREQPSEVLNTIAEGDQAERAVAQVWLLTLDQLREVRPAAIDLLRILSCYAPDDVPRSILAGYAEQAGAVDQALAALASYNLVILTQTTVSMHRLLQTVVRSQTHTQAEADDHDERSDPPESFWYGIVDQALALLDEALPPGNLQEDVDIWPQWRLFTPHVEALAQHISQDTADLTFANLLGQLGSYHYTQGRYHQALQADKRALEISEAALSAGHPTIATRLDNLARTLGELGRAGEALPLRRRALEISEAALLAGHPTIAIRLNNLAHTLGELGRAGEALPLRRRALEISEAALPAGHPTIATRLNNLAHTLGELGRPGEALPLQRRALEISEAALPAGHPDIATRLDNLAYTLGELGQPGEALALQRRALEISEAALPAGHPDIATRLDNLAYTLGDLGQAGEALPLQRRALEISEAALPAGHPTIALRMDNLAYTLGALGRAGEALALQRRALEISEAALPAGHPDIATRLDNLAYTLGELGQPGEALPLQRRALEISEAALPTGHPDIATRLNNLAHTLGALGRAGEALPLQRRALEISEAALPAGHPDTAIRLHNLAYTLRALGLVEEALPLQRRAAEINAEIQRRRSSADDVAG
ncbi:FxSxx-COOH system tetratricopeptide repeat protein [Micromonospora sp. CA-246542]|uniref:FxSxx-COOH system tetratricopeptide repeat protein n=1 Tax=Micromonospora sp. CA-246542 TaxID=3239959 RepID=UPI003D8B8C90